MRVVACALLGLPGALGNVAFVPCFTFVFSTCVEKSVVSRLMGTVIGMHAGCLLRCLH